METHTLREAAATARRSPVLQGAIPHTTHSSATSRRTVAYVARAIMKLAPGLAARHESAAGVASAQTVAAPARNAHSAP